MLWKLAIALTATSLALEPAQQGGSRTPDTFFVPTRHAVADAMLRFADVTRDDVVYDLGSGDGRVLILAAQKYGARGVGIELDAALVEKARLVAAEGGVADRVTFVEGDLFAANIGEATVVTLYLSTLVTRRLAPKLSSELKPGTRVVSQQFDMGPWRPDATMAVEGVQLYLWRMPLR